MVTSARPDIVVVRGNTIHLLELTCLFFVFVALAEPFSGICFTLSVVLEPLFCMFIFGCIFFCFICFVLVHSVYSKFWLRDYC